MVICPHCEKEIDVPEIVEVDPNQELPKNPYGKPLLYGSEHRPVYRQAQQDMIKAGWRKVIE